MKFSPTSFFHFGIRQKLLLVLLLVLLTTLSISSWFTLNEEKQRIIKQIDNRGSDISRFVSKSLTYSVVGYDYHTIDLLLKEITLSAEVDYAKVLNNKGKIISQAGTFISDSSRMLIFTENINLDGEKLGALTLGLNTNLAHEYISNQGFKFLQRELFITIIILLLEFFALSYLIIRPVTIISNSLMVSDEINKIALIPLESNDEFGQLAKQFNTLNAQLNSANQELLHRVDFADQQLRQNINELKAQKTELTRINQEFFKLSITDSLTELYNRRYFEEQLEADINLTQRHGDTMSLVILDIDHFKNINDTYGHVHGDKVLQNIAHKLKRLIRKTDIACRIGGEEFALIFKRTNKDTAIELADNLRKTIQELVTHINDYNVRVTISAGIATLTKNNFPTHATHLYRFADLALYKSKENGRNTVSHYDEVIEQLQASKSK